MVASLIALWPMKLFVEESIERYARDHTQPFGALHDELQDYTHAEVPVPQMQVGRTVGRLLKMLASLCGANYHNHCFVLLSIKDH